MLSILSCMECITASFPMFSSNISPPKFLLLLLLISLFLTFHPQTVLRFLLGSMTFYIKYIFQSSSRHLCHLSRHWRMNASPVRYQRFLIRVTIGHDFSSSRNALSPLPFYAETKRSIFGFAGSIELLLYLLYHHLLPCNNWWLSSCHHIVSLLSPPSVCLSHHIFLLLQIIIYTVYIQCTYNILIV